MMRFLLLTCFCLGFFYTAATTPALAADPAVERIFPPDGSTLHIDRTTKPDRLLQEVDPSYAFHAKAARARLKKALYELLMARNEYKLYLNHMRTLQILDGNSNLNAINQAAIALRDELYPTNDYNPLAVVGTNLPEVGLAVEPQSRAIVTPEPVSPLDNSGDLFDGLSMTQPDAGASTGTGQDTPAQPAPFVGQVAPTPKPAATSAMDLIGKANVVHANPITPDTNPAPANPFAIGAAPGGLPVIPAYKPKSETCPTCSTTGPPVSR